MTRLASALAPAIVAAAVFAANGVAAAAPSTGSASQTLPAVPLVFRQLTIEAAEAAAVAASPDVAAARAREQQSESALSAARAGTAPSLVATYVQVPQGNPPGPNVISRQVTTGVAVAIGDLLANAPAVREAAFTLAASVFDERAAESLERVKVVGLYFDALKARAVAEARRGAVALATTQGEGARVRVAAGDAPQLDVLRADVALARAQADVESASAADLNATEALRVETNSGESALVETTPGNVTPAAAALTDPQSAVALARVSRPDIESARRTAEAASAAIGSARALGFPPLTVTGGYLTGTDSGVPVNAPTINAQLTLPLSSASGDRVRLAEARALEARAKATGVERQALLDVAASARTLGAAERASAATTRARQSAQSELRATEIGYRSGASSSFEVTSARATYAQTLVDELSALYDAEKARATLDIEVGR